MLDIENILALCADIDKLRKEIHRKETILRSIVKKERGGVVPSDSTPSVDPIKDSDSQKIPEPSRRPQGYPVKQWQSHKEPLIINERFRKDTRPRRVRVATVSTIETLYTGSSMVLQARRNGVGSESRAFVHGLKSMVVWLTEKEKKIVSKENKKGRDLRISKNKKLTEGGE